MKEILRIVYKYKFSIILVLILLIVQAFLDLTLPEYTSKIVDIGIAQSGIENNVPIKWRRSEFDKVRDLVDNKELLDSSYECGSNECELVNYSEELSNMLVIPELSLMGIDHQKYKGNESLLSNKLIEYVKLEYKALDIDIEDYSFNYIVQTGIRMLFIAGFVMLVTFLSVYMSSKVMANVTKDLRVKVFSKVVSFESEEVNKFSSASLITRCTNDVMQVGMLVMAFLRIVVYAPILGVGALVKVNTSGVSYLVAVPVILILLVMIILFLVIVPKMKVFQERLDRLTVVSREILSGIPVIRAFTNERKEEERFEVENDKISKTSLFIDRGVAFINPALTLIINSVSILIVWVCSSKIDSGLMGVGEMIAISTYVIQISMVFLMISMVAMMVPRSLVSIKRLSEIFNTKVSVCDKENFKCLEKIKSIEFKDVSFRYSVSGGNVLSNISFCVSLGESIGIIGSTGSGKSSFVNLIPRFYDVSEGSILINGQDIRDYKLDDVRKCVSYVSQKGWLKSGTIESNIKFGLGSDMEGAAEISQSLKFINEKDKGFASLISQGGSNVSGGQRQRLAIARALYKKSDVLILDDATSALDYKTDSNLRSELNNIKNDKILFVTSQRVSSVMHLDKIMVIDNGKIAGIGTDKELQEKCSIYREIRKSQLGGEV